MGLKLNLYLTSLSRGSPVYPSTQLFSILTLQKQLKICLFFQKSLKNGCNNLYFHYFTFNEGKKKSVFLSDVVFPSWPGTSVYPNFRQYQFNRNNDKFDCFLQIQSKMAARISIFTLKPLNYFKIKFIFIAIFPSWPGNSVNPVFSQCQSYKNS